MVINNAIFFDISIRASKTTALKAQIHSLPWKLRLAKTVADTSSNPPEDLST